MQNSLPLHKADSKMTGELHCNGWSGGRGHGHPTFASRLCPTKFCGFAAMADGVTMLCHSRLSPWRKGEKGEVKPAEWQVSTGMATVM